MSDEAAPAAAVVLMEQVAGSAAVRVAARSSVATPDSNSDAVGSRATDHFWSLPVAQASGSRFGSERLSGPMLERFSMLISMSSFKVCCIIAD